MPCHVSYDNRDSKLNCQFKSCSDVIQNIPFDDKEWCWLHLPIKSPDGNISSPKDMTSDSIHQVIYALIDNLLAKDKKEVNLSYTVFPESFLLANLIRKVPSGIKVNLENSHFWGKIFLEDSQLRDFNFNGVSFHDDCSFIHSVFFDCSFQNIVFCKRASFLSSTLANIRSNKGVLFNGSRFHDETLFTNTAFKAKTNFKQVIFFSSVDFSFMEGLQNLESKNMPAIDFYQTEFSEVTFDNRTFSSKTDFSACIFHKPPQFHRCKIYQYTIFPPQKNFLDTKSAGAASAYRTLSFEMASLKARREEAMFYSLEQESLKNSGQMKPIDLFLSCCYKWFAGYGQSISRPLTWLSGAFVIAFLFYSYFLTPNVNINAPIDWNIIGKSLYIAFLQIVKPFSIDTLRDYSFIKYLLNTHAGGVRIIANLQSLFSIIFIALTLFAIRWKFKRD
jgi:uncharacterized protein YjbI with pentapeptide repeats